MTERAVVIYLSPHGKPLRRAHQRLLLEEDAKAIAKLKQCEFGGYYPSQGRPAAPLFFVPDQTLLCEEAEGWGSPARLSCSEASSRVSFSDEGHKPPTRGSLCPSPGRLVGAFAVSVSDLVLHGYTAFDPADASKAAQHLLQHGTSIRLKRTACSGGRGQMVVTAAHEAEEFVRNLPLEEMTASGVLLEENLQAAAKQLAAFLRGLSETGYVEGRTAGCCACAASGYPAAPPSSVMNSRRLLTRSPRRRGRARSRGCRCRSPWRL
jgi:Protein of unknown function (DUF3182)